MIKYEPQALQSQRNAAIKTPIQKKKKKKNIKKKKIPKFPENYRNPAKEHEIRKNIFTFLHRSQNPEFRR